MSGSITITIPMAAFGKERPRGANFRTPKKTRDYESAIAQWVFLVWRHLPPLEGPVRLEITAEYAMPPSWPAKKRAAHLGQPKVSVPDGDNIQKAISDAINGIAWKDDAQITEWSGRKLWAGRDRITIRIGEIA